MKKLTFTLFLLSCLSAFSQGYKIEWVEPVDEITDQKARVWLDSLVGASFRVNGTYPDTLTFFLTQSHSIEDGCGWAYVKFPKKICGVYMDVNVHAPLDTILSNWEPPHEISHLALPFFGAEYRWLSEGFATYMSRQVMKGLGLYDDVTIKEFYHDSFRDVGGHFDRNEPFEYVAREKVVTHQYAAFYRGGAMYFYVCNYFILERKGMFLSEVVKKYQSTNKKTDKGFDEIIDSFDEIIGEPIMRKVLYNFKITPAKVIFDFVMTH